MILFFIYTKSRQFHNFENIQRCVSLTHFLENLASKGLFYFSISLIVILRLKKKKNWAPRFNFERMNGFDLMYNLD